MNRKALIALVLLVLALVGGGVAAYAYDSSRADVVAEGVTAGGVDVGGLTRDQARRFIRRELSGPLERPISVVAAGKRFSLSAEDARVHVDVDRMVREALAHSRDGSIFSRVARDLTGAEEQAPVALRVTYDGKAVDRLVGRVQQGLGREARDAEVDFPSLRRVEERPGRAVRVPALRKRLVQALTVPGAAREVRAPVRVVAPEVTQAELADEYPVVLITDRNSFKLRLYKQLTLVKEYTVAVGALGFDTPAGLYHIQNKAVNPSWTVPNSDWAGELAGQVIPPGPDNPLKARWLGIYDGAGIHGTDQTETLGTRASKGCLRMAIPDVIELYEQVPVGAPIYIA